MNKFFFYKNNYIDKHESDAIFIQIPTGIFKKSEILSVYFEKLSFPSYFGFNWDALYDCLNDLSWIVEYNIIIVHEDLPFLTDEKEREIYLKLLLDIIANWDVDSTHKLKIYFPEQYKNKIEMIL